MWIIDTFQRLEWYVIHKALNDRRITSAISDVVRDINHDYVDNDENKNLVWNNKYYDKPAAKYCTATVADEIENALLTPEIIQEVLAKLIPEDEKASEAYQMYISAIETDDA